VEAAAEICFISRLSTETRTCGVQNSVLPSSTRDIYSARDSCTSSDLMTMHPGSRTFRMSGSSTRRTYRRSGSSNAAVPAAMPVAEAQSASSPPPFTSRDSHAAARMASETANAHNGDLLLSTAESDMCLPVHMPDVKAVSVQFRAQRVSDKDKLNGLAKHEHGQSASARAPPMHVSDVFEMMHARTAVSPPAPRHCFMHSLQPSSHAEPRPQEERLWAEGRRVEPLWVAQQQQQRHFKHVRCKRWEDTSGATANHRLVPATRASSTPAKQTMLQIAKDLRTGVSTTAAGRPSSRVAAGQGGVSSGMRAASRSRPREQQNGDRRVWVPAHSASKRTVVASAHMRPRSLESAKATTSKQVNLPRHHASNFCVFVAHILSFLPPVEV
jgi:hypothetical protein